jgi:pantoate kinase
LPAIAPDAGFGLSGAAALAGAAGFTGDFAVDFAGDFDMAAI